MPACADQELLLGGLVDGELDAANIALVEAHVARCEGLPRGAGADCRRFGSLLRADGVRHDCAGIVDSSALRRMDRSGANAAMLPPTRYRLPALARARDALGALAASLALVMLLPPGPIQQHSVVDEEIVSEPRALAPAGAPDRRADVRTGTS
jgi:hypothetical protein